MSADEIVWEDPPESGTPLARRDWGAFVAELKEHPGKWAIAHKRPRNGMLTQVAERLRERGCDATVRKQPDGTHTLYARWPEDAS